MTAPTVTHLPGGDLQLTGDAYVAHYDTGSDLLTIHEFAPEYGPHGPHNAGVEVMSIYVSTDQWEPEQLMRRILTALEPEPVLRELDYVAALIAEGEGELALAAIAKVQGMLR